MRRRLPRLCGFRKASLAATIDGVRKASLAATVALGLAGCYGSDGGPVRPQPAMNPSGKPRTVNEADTARKYQEAGDRANAQMAEAARHMQEAQGK
ncbi:MAG TPA: hypothetical protein VG820_12315 [Fimbriimonadaceae bacterium]|nr:hypothetical protein [Fimbriimonadaceae bacterium]